MGEHDDWGAEWYLEEQTIEQLVGYHEAREPIQGEGDQGGDRWGVLKIFFVYHLFKYEYPWSSCFIYWILET